MFHLFVSLSTLILGEGGGGGFHNKYMVAATCLFWGYLFWKILNYRYTISTKWESTLIYGFAFRDKKKFGINICMNLKQYDESSIFINYILPFYVVTLHFSLV